MAIVLGGGISGLSAAYYVTKKVCPKNFKLLLLEKSKRCGGWIKSTDNSGTVFEAGPRTIRPMGAPGSNTLNLIEDIGLSDKVIPILHNHPAATNRLVYAKKSLSKLPNSFMDVFKIKPPFTRPLAVALLRDLFSSAPKDLKDDSLYNFVERRLGTEIADYAISPLICGVCAGDAKEISVKFILNRFFEFEQKYGGIIKGIIKSGVPKLEDIELSDLAKKSRMENWNIYSLRGGLEELPKALNETVVKNGAQILNDHQIQEIKFYDDNNKACVKMNQTYAFSTSHLISSIPSFELANLLSKQHPILSEELNSIPFVDVAVVNLQYDSDKLLKENAFGFLVPPKENIPILGVIFDSCCFSNQKGTVLTVMLGGKWFKQYLGTNPSEEQILDIATFNVKEILKIQNKPHSYKINILNKCIPQYVVGHEERIKRIRQYIKDNNLPLSLCGSSYDGVGINDVILSAKNAADNVVKIE